MKFKSLEFDDKTSVDRPTEGTTDGNFRLSRNLEYIISRNVTMVTIFEPILLSARKNRKLVHYTSMSMRTIVFLFASKGSEIRKLS